MPKYVVRFESREYYEKEYEADSFDEAVDRFYEDDKLFESHPYDSDISLIEVENEYEGCMTYA